MRLTYDSKRAAAQAKASTRSAPEVSHPLIALQRAVGNRAVSTALARASEGATEQAAVGFPPVQINAERHEQELREEIAGALNVPPGDVRVDVAIFGDVEVARAERGAPAG